MEAKRELVERTESLEVHNYAAHRTAVVDKAVVGVVA